MSFFGRAHKGKTETIAIIDVGSGSVGAALTVLDKNGPPSMLSQMRIETPVDASRDAQTMADQIIKATSAALMQVCTITQGDTSPAIGGEQTAARAQKKPEAQNIDHVAIFLPAPWSQLFLRTIRLADKEKKRVTTSLIEQMIADYVKRERPDEETEEIIERSALGIRLNGYSLVDIPKNAIAETTEIMAVSVTASKQLLNALRSAVREVLGHAITISFHSTNISCSYALSVVLPNQGDYLVCNGEGELTELLLVLEHIPVGSASSPQGCNTILRTLSVHADMARAEASSALTLAQAPGSPMAEKLDQTLASAQKECAEGFYAAAEQLFIQNDRPSMIYTLGQGSEAQWYAAAIAQSSSLKQLFPAGISVQSIPFAMLSPFIGMGADMPAISTPQAGLDGVVTGQSSTVTPLSSKTVDIFLALEAIFADSRFDERRTFNFTVTQK